MNKLSSKVSVHNNFVRSVCLKPTARPSLRVNAQDDKPAGLDFSPGKRASLGYTDEDSAGQSNIFAVEPQVSIQRGAGDTTTKIVAGVGAALAAGAIFLGLTSLRDATGPEAVVANGDSLTNIYQRLASSPAPWVPAAPVVEAPPPAVEASEAPAADAEF
eukprot:CAMPEP_0197856868 /NCGR_PEP_ID=MMETSP1438-20131217/29389_1 /TAXON_ID=1461541 /ORGANISM="Pterosperma sp., Strain CCMP1384" /LENGTH=159 /DNA_ID=CAMNT_0043472481 /DNA_START=144 /DNA_END=623 /DNA_ORIENTATION=+